MQLSTFSRVAAFAALTTLVACGGKATPDTAAPEPAPAPAPAPEPEPEPDPVAPIPEGRFALTPTLTVKGVDAAVDFYAAALGAKPMLAIPGPDGKTMHAEIMIGDSVVMLGEENEAEGMRSPLALGGSPGSLMVYVDDVDAAFATALGAGATQEQAPEDMFWGDRWGSFTDPFGHRWAMATHIEELTGEQMGQRAEIINTVKNPKKAAKKWKKIQGTPATEKKPAQYHTVTPALTAANADEAIKFYKQAFGAIEIARLPTGDGRIMHAEIKIGDSALMVHDEFPEMGSKSAKTLGGSPINLYMYAIDVDMAHQRATNAMAKEAMPVADMFWGDRYSAVIDSQGYMWGLASRIENLTPEQITERMQKAMSEQGGGKA